MRSLRSGKTRFRACSPEETDSELTHQNERIPKPAHRKKPVPCLRTGRSRGRPVASLGETGYKPDATLQPEPEATVSARCTLAPTRFGTLGHPIGA